MKKSKLKYIFYTGIAALGIAALTVYSCEKEVIAPQIEKSNSSTDQKIVIPSPSSVCGKVQDKILMDDNQTVIGHAIVYNDTKNFYVSIKSNVNFVLGDASMHISPKADEFPLDGLGNPVVSEFTYSINAKPLSTVRKFVVPLSNLNGSNFIAVHVNAKPLRLASNPGSRFMSAWLNGRSFGNTTKGQLFSYTKQQCLENLETSVAE